MRHPIALHTLQPSLLMPGNASASPPNGSSSIACQFCSSHKKHGEGKFIKPASNGIGCVVCAVFRPNIVSNRLTFHTPRCLEKQGSKIFIIPIPNANAYKRGAATTGRKTVRTFTTGGVSARFAKILADDHSPRYVLSIARHRLLPPRHTRLCFSRSVCMCLYAIFPSQLFAFHSHYWSF